METTIEALEETARWFDSLPILTDAEIEEMDRLDSMKHKSAGEI